MFLQKGDMELGPVTDAQIWSLKAYWLSYQLGILDALVKDMNSTFADSQLPPEILLKLNQFQPYVNSSNTSAKQLCDSAAAVVDTQKTT